MKLDPRTSFKLHSDNWFGKTVKIFRVNDSFSVHAGSKKKDILVTHKGPTDILDNTTITEEAKYFTNLTEQNHQFFVC